MFNIIGNTIKVTRSDECAFDVELSDGNFEVNDEVIFAIYKAGGLNQNPVLEKHINVTKQSPTVTIELNTDDTNIGTSSNHEVKYWYQISINDNQTILGFQDNIMPEFIIMPKGGVANV